MKKTLLCVLVCLMGCFFLGGCDFTKIPDPYGIMEPTQELYEGLDQLINPQGPQEKASMLTKERYTIVVDDGNGMKGFVSSFCLSYSAAISAVANVSMSSERACYRASAFDSAAPDMEKDGDSFFQNAVQKKFFQPKSNDIAVVIANMAKSYTNDPNQVMILISDLMIPTEDDCMIAAKALQESVVYPENATMGIISILGEFRGSIENLPVSPVTGQPRKISDYMVLTRDGNGNFRHPLYLLFLGDDHAVLNAMEKALTALNGCGLLDEEAAPKALYFSEYGISRRDQDDIFSEFNLGCQQYNLANYPAEYVVSGVASENGSVRYPAASNIPEEYQQVLRSLPIVKIYDLERGNTEKNVRIRCTIPFSLRDSSKNGNPIQDIHQLLTPAEKLKLDPEDYQVSADIRMFEYNAEGIQSLTRWVTPEASRVYCESAVIDENRKKIDVVLSLDTNQIKKDVPMLYSIGVRVTLNPEYEEIAGLYQSDWVKELTLNLKEYDKESFVAGKAESSARFTEITTAHTPFLSNLICGGVGEQQIATVIKTLSERTAACVQTTMFGIVVRDVPNRYLSGSTWDETEDFNGWAFNVKDAMEIQSAID